MAIHRNYARYGAEITLYESVNEFLKSPLCSEASAMAYGAGLLEILVEDNSANTTIVMFHAAVNPAQTTLPVFVGRNFSDSLEANVVYISDPSLELNSPIGWFAGDSHRKLQEDLSDVIRHTLTELGAKHTIFFGMSAGGFAALYYSNRFEGSLAVVANPQTNILKYHDDGVNTFVNNCWDSIEQLKASTTWNLNALYSNHFPNHVLYLQNKDDHFHIENHLKPFQLATRSKSHRLKIHIDDWGEGHAPVPAFLLHGILGYAIECSGDWPKLFSDELFTD